MEALNHLYELHKLSKLTPPAVLWTHLTGTGFLVFLKQSSEVDPDDMPSPKMSPKRKTISFSINVGYLNFFHPIALRFPPWIFFFVLMSYFFFFLLEFCGETGCGTSILCKGNSQSGHLWKQEALWSLGSSQITPNLQRTQTHSLHVTLVWQSTWTM